MASERLKMKKLKLLNFLPIPWIENNTEKSFLALKSMKESLISN
jgi:hypothetical protein